MTKHILVATDGSDQAREAVTMAADLAKALNARLTVLHVILHGLRAEEATRLADAEHLVRRVSAYTMPQLGRTPASMNEFFQESQGDIPQAVSVLGDHIARDAAENARSLGVGTVDTRVEPGDYAETILAVADEIGADLIVIGSRGLGGLRGLLIGSVSQKVVQHAPCSVVVVR
ncbi:Universal stress protein UspA-related nucleotide-binding protein (plasmid) [Sinorhizobium sojae CCBAU 05684]|uniref:Universal stress protein UspA-related nucleotide-binding protein n=1 Tax=Sinorhizobium sojae CCBAU 05684 TaxID=716928 RepID=A0A249PIM6_9HYPH|nr:universal stress protein [Sinorhizobium sojae]ASY65768.1 Universal stress protein UspA-related nucleotide-binding protein [Sinorhizobium sojae CCBAU 05684]